MLEVEPTSIQAQKGMRIHRQALAAAAAIHHLEGRAGSGIRRKAESPRVLSEDIALRAVFLASNMARCITGVAIPVDSRLLAPSFKRSADSR